MVPMLAPRMNGTTPFSLTNFLATRGTTNDVVIVLDLIAAVINSPQPKDWIGLLKKYRFTRSCVRNPSKLEITRLKRSIDPKSMEKERMMRTSPLPISSTSRVIIAPRTEPRKDTPAAELVIA